ncbi:MAG: Gfo/Idh/MocA family protein [Thermoguttaceae bacterium]
MKRTGRATQSVPQSPGRRRFLAASLAAGGATIIPASVLGRTSQAPPSQQIRVGVVGLGSRGFNLVDDLLAEQDARIVALCDVDSLHHRDRPWGQGPAFGRDPARRKVEKHYGEKSAAEGLFLSGDFRQLCARDDIDAIVVATPDHWHALVAIAAIRAGKDVYCEKPLAHQFAEGQAICREAARHKTVFQVGSQQRSSDEFRRAVELVLNGHIGKVTAVEVGLPSGYPEPMGDPTIEQPPSHLDYELWCGPAPKLPYMRARHHRWWRGHLAFGGGVLMDWIGHHNDIAQWALGEALGGPQRVEAVGWTFPPTDIYNTPHHYQIRCLYAGGIASTISDAHRTGTRWIGEEGWVFVDRGKLEASDPAWTKKGFDPGKIRLGPSPGHMRNFLDCVASRRQCVAPPEIALRSITPGLLGYVSNAVGRALRWDSQQQRILEDDEAQKTLMSSSFRPPWSLEG